jgi:hypothetical protein
MPRPPAMSSSRVARSAAIEPATGMTSLTVERAMRTRLAPTSPRAPNGLRDRVKLRSYERTEARRGRAERGGGRAGGGCRGRILDVFDRRATKGRDVNVRFHDGSQPVRCSRCRSYSPSRVGKTNNLPSSLKSSVATALAQTQGGAALNAFIDSPRRLL